MSEKSLLFFFVASIACSAHAQQPNIVLLFSDDAGYADFGFMDPITGGQSEVLTPHLDALASQSVVMSSGYVTGPTCASSRSGLLTGRYQARYGVGHNYSTASTPTNGLPTDQTVIPERLQELGYYTGAIGKWHIGSEDPKKPNARGFDEFYGILHGSRPFFGSSGHTVYRQDTAIAWDQEASFNGIAPDPINGRHFTDALGDESCKFIANNTDSPFFLYTSFNAPHSPYDKAKQEDLALYPSMPNNTRKNVAALMHGMDRAVGQIVSRLHDPNGDGDQSDSVYDNTIIVFANDNGGRVPVGGINNHDNTPLRLNKGTMYEGGNRVPFFVKMPGVSASQYDKAVSTVDLFSTFVAAAGGVMTSPTDGVDLKPYLDGTIAGDPHDKLFWRNGGGTTGFAVRKGDWKLTKGRIYHEVRLFLLNADGSGEEDSDDMAAANPGKFAELLKDYIDWEVTLEKPSRSDASTVVANRFDEFRYVGGGGNWDATNVWEDNQNQGPTTTMQRWDAYANAVLVFESGNYVATNNIERGSGTVDVTGSSPVTGLQEYMLNELRLEGTSPGTATIDGKAFLFTESLIGQPAQITMDATAGTFDIASDVVLYDDLLITGNGIAEFKLSGEIRSLYDSRTVTKTGSSSISLTHVAGDYIHQEGTLVASLDSAVQVGSIASIAGTLEVLPGAITPGLGDVFTVLTAATLTGSFQSYALPALSPELDWRIDQDIDSLSLRVGLTGDFNDDGRIDGLDFLLWQRNPTSFDLNDWLYQGSASSAAIPEPGSAVMAVIYTLLLTIRHRRI